MSPQTVYEEYIIDFQNPVSGITGTRVICGTYQDALSWLGQNRQAAGVCKLTFRVSSETQMQVYGLPFSPPDPPAPATAPPAPVAMTHARVGTPNVPPGFKL